MYAGLVPPHFINPERGTGRSRHRCIRVHDPIWLAALAGNRTAGFKSLSSYLRVWLKLVAAIPHELGAARTRAGTEATLVAVIARAVTDYANTPTPEDTP
jgi:hypothetical protein